MNVRCERCQSEYQFDDARIPAGGMSAKCTSCGHVFFVSSNNMPTMDGAWMVRQASGNVVRFKEMTTLQRWIVERKVGRQDEISKTGRSWKALGEIAELSPFFAAVESSAAKSGFAREAEYEAARAPTRASPPSISPEDDDDFELPKKSKRGVFVLALVAVLLAVVALTYVTKPSWAVALFTSGPNPLALDHFTRGKTELLRDSYAAMEKARDELEQAMKISPDYVLAQATIAESELYRAEYVIEEAEQLLRELQLLPATDQEAARGEIEKRRAEAKTRIDRAFALGKDALAKMPNEALPNRVLADYYRIMKARDAMKPLLTRAETLAPRDAGVSYVAGAAAAADASLAERAISHFLTALEREPTMHRARYKLARVYQAQGRVDDAKREAELILKSVPEHERAQALLLELSPKPVPSVEAPPENPAPPPPVEPEADAKAEPALSAEQLIVRADRLREIDQPLRAKLLYKKALELEPEDPDGLTGLGWCFVDLEEPDDAVVYFRRALALAPRLTDAHMGLAEAYRIKGMKRDAIKHYRSYLDILPDGPESAVAKRMIEELQ